MPLETTQHDAAETDRCLTARARQGDRDAFGELVRRYEKRLLNVLLRRVRRIDEAEDIAQQAFLQAWQAIDRYDARWRFSTWLFTIALRHAADVAARQTSEAKAIAGVHHLKLHGNAMPSQSAHEPDDTARNLWHLAEQVLSADERLALWLRYIEDLPVRDVAAALGRSGPGVRVIVHRAKRRLQTAIAAAGHSGRCHENQVSTSDRHGVSSYEPATPTG